MNYLYFAEGTVATTGTGCMFAAKDYLGFDPNSATTSCLNFKTRTNAVADDQVVVTHASGKHKEVAELIASILAPSSVVRDKFIVVADEEHGVYLDNGNGAGLNGVVEVTTV